MKPLFLPAFLILLCFASCKKNDNPAPVSPTNPDTTGTTPVKPVDSTLTVDLTYPESSGAFGPNYELIISEASGAILLDSMTAFNASFKTTLKTKQPTVDLTAVIFSPTYNIFAVYVYKAVRPGSWVNVTMGDQANLTYPNSFPAKISYTNTPAVDINSVLFSSLPAVTSGGVQLSFDYYTPQQLDISYPGRPGIANFAYLDLPTLGLYNYHAIQTADDTVDLTHMDTCTLVHFNKPPQYTFHSPYLKGFMDTTDLTNYQVLYLSNGSNPIADIQYPPKNKVPVQKYYLYADATTTNNETVSYITYQDSVPTVLPWPATPIYSISSTQSNNFSVSFTQKPTAYETSWNTGNIGLYISAPGDSTNLQPLNLMNTLNSRMLKGQSLAGLTLTSFDYTIAPGVDYNSYFTHQSDPLKVTTQPYAALMMYYKSIP